MNSTHTPAPVEVPSGGPDVQKACALTFEIASLANAADSLAYNFAAGDADAAAALVHSLRETICKVGWLADLASEHLGGNVAVGGAQDWLLPPACVGRPSRHDIAGVH